MPTETKRLKFMYHNVLRNVEPLSFKWAYPGGGNGFGHKSQYLTAIDNGQIKTFRVDEMIEPPPLIARNFKPRRAKDQNMLSALHDISLQLHRGKPTRAASIALKALDGEYIG